MYLDEDGDLAHEFYEEISPPSGKPWMRRITENIFPQVYFLTTSNAMLGKASLSKVRHRLRAAPHAPRMSAFHPSPQFLRDTKICPLVSDA